MSDPIHIILKLFEQINAIPRCSRHEEAISRWLLEWAAGNRFETAQDAAGNIVIRVPATSGYENASVIVIQGHMDMVCEKTPESSHDFSRDPIRMIVDGDWLKADNTTLGADNGIALAIGMALAENTTIDRPPIELLFTVDEETGLTGAAALAPGFITGRVLLNLDSEDEGVFTVGCAGGRDTRIRLPLQTTRISDPVQRFRLTVGGLRGGHSGIDINAHRANANVLLGRILSRIRESASIRLVEIAGGTAHNAIPRDASVTFICNPAKFDALAHLTEEFQCTVKEEYAATEKNLFITLEQQDMPEERYAVTLEDSIRVVDLIYALPHGVAGTSADVPGLVETSSNLATIAMAGNELDILSSQRSSIPSRLDEINRRIEAVAALAGAKSETGGQYPPWQPDMASPLLARSQALYRRLFGSDPTIQIIHAGLECGIIGATYPGMDMISFGPTLRNPHSPDERLHIPSIGRMWTFLVELLKSYQ